MTPWLRPLQQLPEYSEAVFHEMMLSEASRGQDVSNTTVDSVLGVGTFLTTGPQWSSDDAEDASRRSWIEWMEGLADVLQRSYEKKPAFESSG